MSPPGRILLLEADRKLEADLREWLEKEGYRVAVETPRAEDRAHAVDAIILGLPLSSADVLTTLPPAPLLLLSAEAPPRAIEQWLRAPYPHRRIFLSKPIEERALLSGLAWILGGDAAP